MPHGTQLVILVALAVALGGLLLLAVRASLRQDPRPVDPPQTDMHATLSALMADMVCPGGCCRGSL